jgi:hypothetical protein
MLQSQQVYALAVAQRRFDNKKHYAALTISIIFNFVLSLKIAVL